MAGEKSAAQLLCVVVLSLAVSTEALQNHNNRDVVTEGWNPLDALHPKDASEANADSKRDLKEKPEDVKDAIHSSLSEKGDTEHVELAPHLKPLGDPIPPRMIVTAGCDGSGAILKHAHEMLMLHGIVTPAVNTADMSSAYGDIAQGGPGISGTSRDMVQMHYDFLKQDQTLLFKGTIGKDQEEILSKSLYALDTKVVKVTRRNELDQVVCMIKDCFNNQMGHPVMNGKKSGLCMERRKEDPLDYKAFVDSTTLVQNIRALEENVFKTTNDLTKMGYSVDAFDAEDLLDFEWDKDQVNTGLEHWKKLLKAWGVRASKDKIRGYLTAYAGTRAAPHNHTETMYNFASVKGAVKGHDGLTAMLRE